MRALAFRPISVVLGLLAGFAGKGIFARLWGLVDKEEPPAPKDRKVPWAKVLAAAAIQGAIFRLTRTVVDRGARRAWLGLTGAWPGEERPDPEG